MAKPKFDFKDMQNIIRIEGWARDGLDDKQIAANIGYNETYFYELKAKIPELSEALARGRAPLEFAVESKVYRRAIGGTVKRQQAVKVKDVYFDEEGRRCERERVEVVDLEDELPSDMSAAFFWLRNRKPKVWNKPMPKEDDETSVPKNINKGIDIDKWIKGQIDDSTSSDI